MAHELVFIGGVVEQAVAFAIGCAGRRKPSRSGSGRGRVDDFGEYPNRVGAPRGSMRERMILPDRAHGPVTLQTD